jgi:hypothetical protein
MDYAEFRALVKDMRRSQERYSNTREHEEMRRARRLEKEVDRVILAGGQRGLFKEGTDAADST